MTEEDKRLLIQELSARLPYRVFVHTWYDKPLDIRYTGIDIYTNTIRLDLPEDDDAWVYINNAKPYPRPLSSMTKEEKKKVCSLNGISLIELNERLKWDIYIKVYTIETFDYFNAKHLDYRGLIEKDLAIEVTEENNPYKENDTRR